MEGYWSEFVLITELLTVSYHVRLRAGKNGPKQGRRSMGFDM